MILLGKHCFFAKKRFFHELKIRVRGGRKGSSLSKHRKVAVLIKAQGRDGASKDRNILGFNENWLVHKK